MTKAVYSPLLFCGLYELDCEGLFHLNTKYSYYNKKCIYGNLFLKPSPGLCSRAPARLQKPCMNHLIELINCAHAHLFEHVSIRAVCFCPNFDLLIVHTPSKLKPVPALNKSNSRPLSPLRRTLNITFTWLG